MFIFSCGYDDLLNVVEAIIYKVNNDSVSMGTAVWKSLQNSVIFAKDRLI